MSPAPGRPPGPLQYKVVELSTVDEGSIERAVNDWVQKGWTLENVQFAMRESSKRPAMAFVFFTHENAPAPADTEAARAHLARLAEPPPESDPGGNVRPLAPLSPRERLAQLAGMDDEADEEGLTLEPDE